MDKGKDRGIKQGIGKSVLAGVVFLGFAIVVTISVITQIFEEYLTDSWSLILAYFLWLFFIMFLSVSLIVHVTDRKILPSLWRNLRPFRTLHFVLMVCIGLAVANNIGFFEPNNVPYIIITVFLLVFLWQYTIMINDVYDMEIDELSNVKRPLIAGVVTRGQYTILFVSMAIISVLFSFFLGPIIIFIALFCLFLGTIYSVPPIRIRDRIWSSVIIGLGSAMAFLIGYFTPNFEGVRADLNSNAILLSLIIFSALSMGPILTDLKDYEGDKKANVRSIYTVFGLEKGKKIASALIPFIFLIPAIILHSFLDVILFMAFGIIGAIIFYKKGDFRLVFGCYFVVLIYSILRIIGTLSGGF